MTTVTDGKTKKARPKPFFFPQLCKACGRCIAACPKDCIHVGTEIDPVSGLVPVVIDLETCNGCGLCYEACPEPHGLMAHPPVSDATLTDPAEYFGPKVSTGPQPRTVPASSLELPAYEPMVLKGNHAAAVGALLAGCRHFFGYPITPSTEGAELMARLLPQLEGYFFQAVSEVATVNMMYGCAGAGLPCMTFTSSPGFSLMLEGISYMVGSELPAVFINVMRGGPGLGNIAPEQADIKLVCRGLGHGNTHALVLAPATPQEMLDLTMLAFERSFHYRTPVIIACDGYLGQMSGRVRLPRTAVQPGLPDWAVWGDEEHRRNLISSIDLIEVDQERFNQHLIEKYRRIQESEQRVDCYHCDDAEWLIVACNTPARLAKGAVHELRTDGIKAGLFRPITLWPFPVRALSERLEHVRGVVVVEAGPGQLEDELRLALSHAGIVPPPITHVQHYGGVLPQSAEVVAHVSALAEVHHG